MKASVCKVLVGFQNDFALIALARPPEILKIVKQVKVRCLELIDQRTRFCWDLVMNTTILKIPHM